MAEIRELKEGDELFCLTCESKITQIADLQNKQPVKKGNIIICGECAAIHKVGDSSLVKFTKEDFAGLDNQSKSLIAMTVSSILHNRAIKGN